MRMYRQFISSREGIAREGCVLQSIVAVDLKPTNLEVRWYVPGKLKTTSLVVVWKATIYREWDQKVWISQLGLVSIS